MAKIYGEKDSFRTKKVLIAAKLAKRTVSVLESSVQKNNLLAIFPSLEDGSTHLFGEIAIAKYFLGSNSVFNPPNPEIDQWLYWSETRLISKVLAYVLPSVSAVKIDSNIIEIAKKEFLAQIQAFNSILLTKTYLVNDRLTIADVSVALNLLPAYLNVLDKTMRTNLVNLNRWFLTITNYPEVKTVVGEIQFLEKASVFNENTFKKLNAIESCQEKKNLKKTEKEIDDDFDEVDKIIATEPKFVDPFSKMPATTFSYDDFKRMYSNEDTATKAIPFFWEKFDPNTNSIWYAEYKYPEELTLTFMSCNLISGMFQRLEKMKKNSFASVCLFGTDNNSSISGIWIWKGQDLIFELCEDWQVDYESYEWKKLNPNEENTRKLINEYLLWEGDFGGKKFNQGKIFK